MSINILKMKYEALELQIDNLMEIIYNQTSTISKQSEVITGLREIIETFDIDAA